MIRYAPFILVRYSRREGLTQALAFKLEERYDNDEESSNDSCFDAKDLVGSTLQRPFDLEVGDSELDEGC